MTKKAPYVPTRTCPHRWCKPLHWAPAPFVLAIIAFDMWHNWRTLVLMSVMVFGAYWTPKLVHFKRRPRTGPVTITHVVEDLRESPTGIDLEMEDAKYEGTGWRMLEVRPWWARIAVGCDLFLAIMVALVSTAMFTNPAEAAKSSASMRIDATMVISILTGLGLFAFNLYAHKKATQPRKPKRAWMPAFLRTSA